MWLFKNKDSEKKLQKELERMDKEDERLAKEIEKDLEKRDRKEQDYELDAKTDDEWMLYERNYTEEASAKDWSDREERDSLEEEKSISEITEDVDRIRNKSEKRHNKHLQK